MVSGGKKDSYWTAFVTTKNSVPQTNARIELLLSSITTDFNLHHKISHVTRFTEYKFRTPVINLILVLNTETCHEVCLVHCVIMAVILSIWDLIVILFQRVCVLSLLILPLHFYTWRPACFWLFVTKPLFPSSTSLITQWPLDLTFCTFCPR